MTYFQPYKFINYQKIDDKNIINIIKLIKKLMEYLYQILIDIFILIMKK